MSPPLTLNCMGRPMLLTPGGQEIRFKTKKHLALLVYLAVEPRTPHRRERLADLLWSGAPGAEGRHSLATALSMLRAKLDRKAFDGSRDYVRFTYPNLRLDLDRLTEGDILGSEVVPALAVSGFLEEFEIPGAEAFGLWREQQRARWFPAIRDALVVLMDRYRRTGDFGAIEPIADRMLGLDELSEEGIRAKMEARAFAGDRLTALRIFEQWKSALADGLGAEPSPLVDGIAVRLRHRGWERAVSSDIPPVHTDQWRGRQFIGRGPEYRVLYEAWERSAQGRPSPVLVVGDSGVGKSTLVERLATAAGLEGAATSRVKCYELEREIPYAALGQLVRGLIHRPGASGTPPEALAELAQSVPEIRQKFPAIPTPPDVHGETARLRLTDAVHQLMLALSEEHPVILVVDDLHLADDASIAVLHLILRRAETERLMVVFTVRPNEPGTTPNATRLIERHHELGLHGLTVPPMSVEESAQLLASLVPSGVDPPGASARQALIRASAGYPMAMELLLRDWLANGEQCVALSVEAMTERPLREGAPIDAYRLGLERLSQTLTPAGRTVLTLAAVLGARLNELPLYALLDLTLAQALSGLAELASLRVLRDGGQNLEFTNELVRAQAYLTVPGSLRRVLHAGVAERLLQAERHGEQVPGLEVAWHLIRGGRPTEATPYLLRGSREAVRRGAPHEAELGLSSALDGLRDTERSEAIVLLAEVLQEQGRFEESQRLLIKTRDDIGPAQTDSARVLVINAEYQSQNKTGAETASHFEELTRLIEAKPNAVVQVKAARVAATLLDDLRAPHLVRRLHDGLKRINELGISLDQLGELAFAKALVAYYTKDNHRGLQELRETTTRLTDAGVNSQIVGSMLSGVAALQMRLGQYQLAQETCYTSYEISKRLGHASGAMNAATNLACCKGRLGDSREQERWALMALAQREGSPPRRMILEATINLATAYTMQGKFSQALLALEQVEQDSSGPSVPTWALQAWDLRKADILRLCGKEVHAIETGKAAVGRSERYPCNDAFSGCFARWTAILADHGTASRESAVSVLRELEASRDSLDLLDQAEVTCALAWLLSRNGCRDAQVEERAIGLVRRLPNGVEMFLRRLGHLPLNPLSPSRRAAQTSSPAASARSLEEVE